MPMLAAEIASTTAKPSMTFARKRKVGSFGDIDRGQTRPDNRTSTPVFFQQPAVPGNVSSREPMPKIRAEWIKGRKFAPAFPVMAGHSRPKDGVASARPGMTSIRSAYAARASGVSGGARAFQLG